MIDTVIPIPVDAETARVYREASAENQKKIQLLLRLRELAELPSGSLAEIMDEIGTKAEARGLTPEILESLLRDE